MDTIDKKSIIQSVKDGLKASDEEGSPTHYVVCHSYSGHEEIISDECSTIEEVVDSLIYIINDNEVDESDLGYSIDGYWEENEVLDTLHYHELNPYDEAIHS